MPASFYQITLDEKAISQLRNAVNEEREITTKKSGTIRIHKKLQTIMVWDLICAIMDRIQDTVQYLNTLKIYPSSKNRSAFDFYDFMNNATVLIDCVDQIAEFFDSTPIPIDQGIDIFHQPGNDGNGTDKDYFRYLRSLCSVHPTATTEHRRYQVSDVECSPFVVWRDAIAHRDDPGDLYAWVYTTLSDSKLKTVPIRMDEIFQYVIAKYNYLEEVREKIWEYQKNMIKQYRESPLRKPDEFGDNIAYLSYLRDMEAERFGISNLPVIEFFISVLQLTLSNPVNQAAYDRYVNAIMYAVPFYANQLQQMGGDDFETTGILYSNSNWSSTLLHELYGLSCYTEERARYQNALEKIDYLIVDQPYADKRWAYAMLKQTQTYFERHISFDNANGDFEHYALVQIALYHDCLENPCPLNRNIPNKIAYRKTLIAKEDWAKLINVSPPPEPSGQLEDLLQWVKELTKENEDAE